MTIERLTVIYDEQCALCRRCRHWLEHEPTYVPLDFLAAGSPAARERYGEVPWLGAELVVVSDDGSVWAGPAAFLTCLWATLHYRTWSYRLSGRTLAPLAERFFHVVSSNRKRIGAMVGSPRRSVGECPDGRCHHREPESARAVYNAPDVTCPACGAKSWSGSWKCWSCGTAFA
ncbi:MAG: DCC1-like thiol-disulfide oxidoreductase family protein [Actinomycetota bacterium]|nr:DCC1-like thiol-disulfide oxidoreductase family protein [Actinomycetota bacterium]